MYTANTTERLLTGGLQTMLPQGNTKTITIPMDKVRGLSGTM